MEFNNSRINDYVESLTTQNNSIWKAASQICRTRTHIPAINCPNGTTVTNTGKAEAIEESLRNQFTQTSITLGLLRH